MAQKPLEQGLMGTVVFMGALPPPIGGAAKNNQIMVSALEPLVDLVLINTSLSKLSHDRFSIHKLQRIKVILHGISKIWKCRRKLRNSAFYFVPDGGLGVLSQLPLAVLMRILTSNIFIHHRNYSYIDTPSALHRALWQITGLQARHIFLSPTMTIEFSRVYGLYQSLEVSNLAFLDVKPASRSQPSEGCWRVGHLSNLCREKGAHDVMDCFEQAVRRSVPISLHLAGPILDADVQERISILERRYPDKIRYYGSLSGVEKDRFFHELDLFLFPTRFKKEAMPNVLFESLAAGTFVIAYGRGCIPDMLPPDDGLVVSLDDDFGQIVCDWIARRSLTSERSVQQSRQLKYMKKAGASIAALSQLLEDLVDRRGHVKCASLSGSGSQL
jgi:glycosyltransferase involved in cell wall biosynthesis